MEAKIWNIIAIIILVLLMYISTNIIDEYIKARRATIRFTTRMLYDALKTTMRIYKSVDYTIEIKGSTIKIFKGDELLLRCIVKSPRKIHTYTGEISDVPLCKNTSIMEVINDTKIILRYM